MSMELYVFSDAQIPSMDVWQRAIDAEDVPLRLSIPFAFGELRGALPARFRERATVFECDHWNAAELIAEYSDIDFGRQWTYALAFRWGSNVYDAIAAYLSASAYARATHGVVLDCEEGTIISAQRAAEIAVELERSIPLIEEAVRRATEHIRR
jgi:hypothetical protein